MSSPKPSLFIGSSREQLPLARAIQQNLHHDFETTVWNQNVFKASAYPLESLADALDTSDVGIFVLVPDDFIRVRDANYLVPRDNVVLELGMFIGKLGRERSFMLVPQNSPKLHLPTDLAGLTPITYDADRRDKNPVAAVGPACSTVRDQIFALGAAASRRRYGIVRAGFFEDFTDRFKTLFDSSSRLTTFFIHSRRWRENHNDLLGRMLAKRDGRLSIFLPDLANPELIRTLAAHFEDGPNIRAFIADAYRYFAKLHKKHPSKVQVRLFQQYLAYTAYVFDDVAIMAMYPTTTLKRPVPTFEVLIDAEFGHFISEDLRQLTLESRRVSRQVLEQMANAAPPIVKKRLTSRSTSRRGARR